MAREEVAISPRAPRPQGYGFLKKGNPFMTGLCRRKTHAAGKTLYVVASRGKPSGLLAPEGILAEVAAEELQTRDKRSAVVEKRDGVVKNEFEDEILRLYPMIPPGEVPKILARTLKKRSRRVGRTGRLELDEKVRLAVTAHVRHCHTDYDKVVKGCKTKWKARDSTRDEVSRVMVSWGGPLPPTAPSKRKRRTLRTPAGPGKSSSCQKECPPPRAAPSMEERRIRQAPVDLDKLAASRRQRKRLSRRRRARGKEAHGAPMAQTSWPCSGPLTRSRSARLPRNRPDNARHQVIELPDSSDESAHETTDTDSQEGSRDKRHPEVIVIEDSDED